MKYLFNPFAMSITETCLKLEKLQNLQLQQADFWPELAGLGFKSLLSAPFCYSCGISSRYECEQPRELQAPS